MRYKIVEITELSGPACKIYSVVCGDGVDTLFDNFQDRLDEDYSEAVDEIWYSLRFMGEEGGARIQFFREDEGRPGDGIVAMLKKKRFALRVYCIRYGTNTLIVGDGGYKPPSVRAWQDDRHLAACVKRMMLISELITERIRDKEIWFSPDGSLLGNLEFEIDDD